MELTMMKNLTITDHVINVMTESFMCEGELYNATYIPTDDSVATVMLEKVVKYPDENVYYRNKINMVTITVMNSCEIKLSGCLLEVSKKHYEIALAAATATYKFDLVKNYLTVEVENEVIPFHINSSNR